MKIQDSPTIKEGNDLAEEISNLLLQRRVTCGVIHIVLVQLIYGTVAGLNEEGEGIGDNWGSILIDSLIDPTIELDIRQQIADLDDGETFH